jgi:hypothetical protein
MITGYETFELYQGLKLHFTSDSYDYFKYGGKSKVSVNSFEKRKDKYHFHKLSRKHTQREEMMSFMVSNFVDDDKTWAGSLLQEEAELSYSKHQKVLQSLAYKFESDCKNLFDGVVSPNDILKTNGDYPLLLTKSLRNEIEIETLCILNSLLGFFPMWTKNIADTIRWPNYRKKVVKYASFIPLDTVKYNNILRKVIS